MILGITTSKDLDCFVITSNIRRLNAMSCCIWLLFDINFKTSPKNKLNLVAKYDTFLIYNFLV